MLTKESLEKAIEAVENLCGKCSFCTPQCPVAIARRALKELQYNLNSESELNR